ncbi:divergent PAP2 family protein [Paraburkholderia dokdonensis]|uniref:divergent PAP2 family protein n=1 Tax=Paraburkholderia dokdonensis TaxID=2211211 RepID=UPI001F248BB6|nr:divergent PAP2 family protein [Paraburkholderia dokdonensis]
MARLVAFEYGVRQPVFGVAPTLAFIVVPVASSLRRHLGRQATVINRLAANDASHSALRERVGHKRERRRSLVGFVLLPAPVTEEVDPALQARAQSVTIVAPADI